MYCSIAFRGIFNLKGNGIAFSQLAEISAFQVISVEKQVISAFAGDKTEIFISKSFDCSLHIDVRISFLLSKY